VAREGPQPVVHVHGLAPVTTCCGRKANSSEHLCNPTDKTQKELMTTISYRTQRKVWRQDKTTENWNLDRKPKAIGFLESLIDWYQRGLTPR